MIALSLVHSLLNILSLLLRPIAQKDSFQLLDNVPGYPIVGMEMYNEINVFVPASTIAVLQPMDQGVISACCC